MNCSRSRSTSLIASSIVALERLAQPHPEAADDLVRVVGGHPRLLRAGVLGGSALHDDNVDDRAVVVPELVQHGLDDHLRLDVARMVGRARLAAGTLVVVAE